MKVKIEFIEPVLGTQANDPEIAREFIASKHPSNTPQDDEVEVMNDSNEEFEKSTTVFPKTKNGERFMWDYQWKGFFKEACEAMIHTGQYTKDRLKKFRLTQYLYKKTIDRLLFVMPRRIILNYNGQDVTYLQRPLRGQTMRGERICLAASEMLPVGTTCEFEIRWLNDNLGDFVEQWLDYGTLLGTLQWRSGGYGRFKWQNIT